MRIALPTIDTNTNKNVLAGGLHANGSICLYDMELKKGCWLRTNELAANMGDLLPALEAQTVTAVIAENMHPMALKILVNKGFSVYKAQGNELELNIELFEKQELVCYSHEAAMELAVVCGGECTTCETDTCDDEKKKDTFTI